MYSINMSANATKMLSHSQHLRSPSIARRQFAPTKEKSDNNVSKHVKEYAEASSIHGIKYITEDGRHHFEKILWVILCTGSFALMIYLILPIYQKYIDFPTVTTVLETNYPVYKVDFPAVTICSNNKVIDSSLSRAITSAYKNENATLFGLILDLNFGDLENKRYENSEIKAAIWEVINTYTFFEDAYDKVNEWSGTRGELQRFIVNKYTKVIPTVMREVMQKCNQMIMACEWQGKMEKCSELFSITRTDAGFCCSFNVVRPGLQLDSSSADASTFDYDYGGIYDDDYFDFYEDEGQDESENGDESQEESGNGGGQATGDTTEEESLATEASETTESDTGGNSDNGIDGISDSDNNGPDKRRKRSTGGGKTNSNNKTAERQMVRKTNSASSVLGLNLLLFQNESDYDPPNQDGIVQNNYLGFKILVHDPYAYPLVTGKGMSIGIGQEAFVSVNAQTRKSDDGVKKMVLRRRQCLTHDENFEKLDLEDSEKYKPKLFTHYTRQGCVMECRAKFSLDECGCLPYYYPEFKDAKMCNVTQIQCLSEIADSFYALGIPAEETDINRTQFVKGRSCKCLPDCDQTTYVQEQSQAKLQSELAVMWLKKKFEKSASMFYNTKGKCCANSKVKNFAKAKNIYNSTTTNSNTTTTTTTSTTTNSDNAPQNNDSQNSDSQEETDDQLFEGMSLVHVYFKDLEIVKYSKQENYGMMDLIAAFGGVVGLCMGFSFLSGAELIYFFTIRYFFDKMKGNSKVKSSG